VVVDHDKNYNAKAVEQWLETHPRVARLLLPTDCPQANPIQRVCGDVHACCTRNHRRKRLPDRVADGEDPIYLNGPRTYQLSALYDEPAVSSVVDNIVAEAEAKAAAWVYQSYMERIRKPSRPRTWGVRGSSSKRCGRLEPTCPCQWRSENPSATGPDGCGDALCPGRVVAG
jgi:hypothetical protein